MKMFNIAPEPETNKPSLTKREIKFKAYMPKLDLMLYNVAVYPWGDIGIFADCFRESVKVQHKDVHIDWDNEQLKLWSFNDGSIIEKVPFMRQKDDWMYIGGEHCIQLQYVGIKDSHGDRIYEGDILHTSRIKFENGGQNCLDFSFTKPVQSIILFEEDRFVRRVYNSRSEDIGDYPISFFKEGRPHKRNKIVGNIYQDKHMIPKHKITMKTIKEKQREVLQTYVNELKKYIKNYSRNGKGLSEVKILCLIKTLESLKVTPYAIGLRHKSEYYEHGDLIILQYKLPCGKTLYYSTTCDCSEDANNYFYTLEDGELHTATDFVQGGEVDAINELTKTLKGTCPEIPRIVYRWISELPTPFDNIVASFAFQNKINT